MRPHKPFDDGGEGLFRHRLENIINPRHELVRLAKKIDWQRFDEAFGPSYGDKGRPALPTPSTTDTVDGWAEYSQIYGRPFGPRGLRPLG